MEALRHSRTHINARRACVLPAAPPAVKMADNMQATESRVIYRLFNIVAASADVIRN